MMKNVLNYKAHTEIVSFPRLYLDGPVLVNLAWLAQLAHVTLGDVLAINLHAVDMLPHSGAHNTSWLSKNNTYRPQCKSRQDVHIHHHHLHFQSLFPRRRGFAITINFAPPLATNKSSVSGFLHNGCSSCHATKNVHGKWNRTVPSLIHSPSQTPYAGSYMPVPGKHIHNMQNSLWADKIQDVRSY